MMPANVPMPTVSYISAVGNARLFSGGILIIQRGTPPSASHWASAALVHERHRFRAAHVAGLKPIELKAGLLDQRANGAIKMAATADTPDQSAMM
jgi:hypothetical protein